MVFENLTDNQVTSRNYSSDRELIKDEPEIIPIGALFRSTGRVLSQFKSLISGKKMVFCASVILPIAIGRQKNSHRDPETLKLKDTTEDVPIPDSHHL